MAGPVGVDRRGREEQLARDHGTRAGHEQAAAIPLQQLGRKALHDSTGGSGHRVERRGDVPCVVFAQGAQRAGALAVGLVRVEVEGGAAHPHLVLCGSTGGGRADHRHCGDVGEQRRATRLETGQRRRVRIERGDRPGESVAQALRCGIQRRERGVGDLCLGRDVDGTERRPAGVDVEQRVVECIETASEGCRGVSDGFRRRDRDGRVHGSSPRIVDWVSAAISRSCAT